MINIIKCEIFKLYKTKKTFISILFMLLAIFYSIFNEFIVNSESLSKSSGNMLPLSLLSSYSSFLLPILIIISVITLINNEHNDGSLTLILLKPFTRGKIILAKFFSISIFIATFLVSSLIIGYLLSYIIFGFSNELVIKGITLSFSDGIKLTLMSYIISIISYIAFISFNILICLLINSPSYATLTSIVLFFASQILNSIFKEISPLLINYYFNSYNTILDINILGFIFGFIINIIYVLIFLSISILIFRKKELK